MAINNDKKWAELNKKLLEGMKSNNWGIMKACYNEMAYILGQEGKEASHLLRERNKCELLELKEAGFEKVQILTARSENVCKECAALEGKIYSIDEALKSMPIPSSACSTDIFSSGKSFCRCLYICHIEE